MSLREIVSIDELPKPLTAMLSRPEACRALRTSESVVAGWIAEGVLPAYRLPTGRYYIDPADLALVVDRLPTIPEDVLRHFRGIQEKIDRLEGDLAKRRQSVSRELAEIDEKLGNAKQRSRWKLLDELTLDELLEYLGDFTPDGADVHRYVATKRGVQQAIDTTNAPQALGKRPKGVPTHAKARRLSTGIGWVDIWYWLRPSGGWSASYGGPRPRRPGGSARGADSAYAAIKHAGLMARYEYGKPVRSSSVRLRFAVLERDGFACHYCGRKPPEVELHVDHVIPVAQAGSNDIDNLVTACQTCNAGKSANELAGQIP